MKSNEINTNASFTKFFRDSPEINPVIFHNEDKRILRQVIAKVWFGSFLTSQQANLLNVLSYSKLITIANKLGIK